LKKFLILLLVIVLALLIAGLYGIVHDQITYTISHEYYTKFEFYQFGLMDMGNEAIFPNPRIEVSAVGFLATWWMGIPIGIILGIVGLILKDYKQMFKVLMKSTLITLIVAFLTGLTGLAYGKFYLVNTDLNWWFPDNLIDKKSFIMVGSMHNFSYIGGLTGMIAGIIYIIRQNHKLRQSNNNELKRQQVTSSIKQ
jgi:hypothetical protein